MVTIATYSVEKDHIGCYAKKKQLKIGGVFLISMEGNISLINKTLHEKRWLWWLKLYRKIRLNLWNQMVAMET